MKTVHALRGVRGEERRRWHEANAQKFEAFAREDSATFDSADFLGGKFRPSNSLPSLPDDDMRSIDQLLERHGLECVLRAVRELCDGRAPNGDFSDSFEVEEDRDRWEEKADALETLLSTLARGRAR